MKQYPPVSFRLLHHLLTVASVEGADAGARRLRSVITQLDLYEPSEQRDTLRAYVDAAISERRLLPTAMDMLNRWAVDAATKQEQANFEAHIGSVVKGEKGGKAPRLQKQIEREAWVQAMDKMLARNPHRSPADMARAIANLPDVDAQPDTIARHLRKVLKTR